MNVRGLKWTRGYVVCSLKGKHIELFINMTIKKQLKIWNIKIVNDSQAVFSISLEDFFKLKPILQKTYTRIHILRKVGLPFQLAKLNKRKGIATGFLLFFLMIYLLSSMVWTIEIEGNQTMTDEEIFQAIEKLGIHRGMFKFQLPEDTLIQEQLGSNLEQASWIGVKLKGTHLLITIMEKVKPDEKPLVGPRHIISSKNAVIYRILAEKGIPQVKVNDRVKKGDLLISGIVGNVENQEAQELVAAEGEVLGVVWYESTVTIPLKQEWKEYTGNRVERKYLMLGNRVLRVKGAKEIPFSQSQKQYDLKQISWKNYVLPIGFLDETILEYHNQQRVLSVSEAIKLAKNQARQDLRTKIDEDSNFKSEKVLHQSTENGKVTVKILFEVLENIATTQPIVQGE
ncbi:MAG: sporulation protein YqfD [Tepidibacillus sp.]